VLEDKAAHYQRCIDARTEMNNTEEDDEKSVVRAYLDKMAKVTGLTGAASIFYILVSEGSRVYPPRNFVPIP
jgi:hypothetical protein